MENIEDKFFDTIIQVVKEICPFKRFIKYTYEYYLEKILLILNDVCKWKSLNKTADKKPKFHYKTIQRVFKIWSDNDIFKIAYYRLLQENVFNKFDSQSTLNLYIDTTFIDNDYGSQLISFGLNKKKKQTKVSIICDDKKIIYGIWLSKASKHDVTLIRDNLDTFISKFNYRKINLIGDKGYISESIKRELDNDNINLIYPHKKNMSKTSKIDKTYLKKRYVVEHSIRDNKRNSRISKRKDKFISTYESFWYISMSLNLLKFIDKRQQIENSK